MTRNTATTWGQMLARTKADEMPDFTGPRAELVAHLEALGYEVDAMTDQVDAFKRDGRGRRVKRIVMMAM